MATCQKLIVGAGSNLAESNRYS